MDDKFLADVLASFIGINSALFIVLECGQLNPTNAVSRSSPSGMHESAPCSDARRVLEANASRRACHDGGDRCRNACMLHQSRAREQAENHRGMRLWACRTYQFWPHVRGIVSSR